MMVPAPQLEYASAARRRPFAEVPRDARQYAVRMRDGVLLATDVYLPSTGRRWPALISRLPYDKAGDECFMPQIARWLTEHGYAVVVQDVRGKVRSDGSLAPFRHEVVDGFDTIEWAAGQQWCDGTVGMFGDSYYGFTQWAAAAAGHPALRAIAPRVTTADFTDALYRQGVFMLEVAACWALETWVDEALYDGQLDWRIRPLADIVPTAIGGRAPVGLDSWASGQFDASARLPVRGDVPALHLGGFWDCIQRGQISTWSRARQRARAPQLLLIDATDHGWTGLREPGRPWEDPQRDSAAMAHFLDGYLRPLVPFFDHFLRDRGDYQVAPVRWRHGREGWEEDAMWPPRDSQPLTWSLRSGSEGRSDHGLSLRKDPHATTLGWVHDPHDPVPSHVHPYYPLITPPDERSVEERADVVSFSTDELTEPLDLTGPAGVTLQVTSSAPSTHVMAKLVDISPDGTAQRILDGAVAASGPWPKAVEVDLGHAGYRLHRGHRMALQLSSSSFPAHPVHPGTDAPSWTATEFQATQQSVVLGGPTGAYLTCFTRTDTRSKP